MQKGICVHARSQLAYALGGRFSALRFTPGLDTTPGQGSAEFEVLVDGETVYESGTLTHYKTAEPVKLDLSGAKTLQLRVDHAGDGIDGDWAVWANSRLEIARE